MFKWIMVFTGVLCLCACKDKQPIEHSEKTIRKLEKIPQFSFMQELDHQDKKNENPPTLFPSVSFNKIKLVGVVWNINKAWAIFSTDDVLVKAEQGEILGKENYKITAIRKNEVALSNRFSNQVIILAVERE